MNKWLIKISNNQEFLERIKKSNDISMVAEEMCMEGKGISFANKKLVKDSSDNELMSQYNYNEDYFELSINLEAKGAILNDV